MKNVMLNIMAHQHPRFFFRRITKYTAVVLALLLGTILSVDARESAATYSVVGIEDGDTLNVRSRPDENSSIITKLRNGYGGIAIGGEAVWNGSDDWVPILFSNAKGWVRPKYLSRDDAIVLNTDVPVRRATAVNADEVLPSDDAPLSQPDTVSSDPYAWVKPAAIIFGLAATAYILNDIFNSGDAISQDESSTQRGYTPAEAEYDRREYQRKENNIATSRGDPPPYPNAPH